MLSDRRVIIPCAGRGTRMHMRHNESKEMMEVDGEPLIEFALKLSYVANADPLVITRSDKRDLLRYCDDRGVETLTIEPAGEWPATILASEFLWRPYNVLILPDTRFEPKMVVEWLFSKMEKDNAPVVFATHEVEDPNNWGIVGEEFGESFVVEKPTEPCVNTAWGLIGFKRDITGLDMFRRMCSRGSKKYFNKTETIKLRKFADVTRG